MKTLNKTRLGFRTRVGVNQRDMANYLGIAPSFFAMCELNQRSLAPTVLKKYEALMSAFEQQQSFANMPPQKLQLQFMSAEKKIAVRMAANIAFYRAKATVLRGRLRAMEKKHADQLMWMNSLEEQLGNLSYNKNDRLWLQIQHDATARHLLKAYTEMVKLRLNIDLLGSNADLQEKHLERLGIK